MKSITLAISILAGILVLSAIVVLAGNAGVATVSETKFESIGKGITSHAPIYINNNSQFTSANGVTSGSGTESDPYIIENWDIDASSATGIEIRNTTVYFIIRNCVIHDGKANNNYGIYFYNVTNGKIDNVTSYNNYYGIDLYKSSNNTISANQIYDNSDDGIYLYDSSNNQISANQIYNNYYGIYLYYSSNNNLSDNQIYNNSWYGVYLYYSSNNQISANQIYNNYYGIYLYRYSSNNEIHYNNIYNNTDYGVYNYNSEIEYQANATYNWWGSADGPSGAGPGGGDAVSSNVIYEPWLTEPVEMDITPPEIIISGVEDGKYYNTSVTPIITITDANLNESAASITLNGYNFTSGTKIEDEGEYTLVVYAVDYYGNTATKTISFLIDKTAPTVTIITQEQTVKERSFTLEWFSEAPDIAYYEVRINAEPWINVGNVTTYEFSLSEGANTIYIRGVDEAGNTGPADSVEIILVARPAKPPKVPWPYIIIPIIVIIVSACVAVGIKRKKKGAKPPEKPAG